MEWMVTEEVHKKNTPFPPYTSVFLLVLWKSRLFRTCRDCSDIFRECCCWGRCSDLDTPLVIKHSVYGSSVIERDFQAVNYVDHRILANFGLLESSWLVQTQYYRCVSRRCWMAWFQVMYMLTYPISTLIYFPAIIQRICRWYLLLILTNYLPVELDWKTITFNPHAPPLYVPPPNNHRSKSTHTFTARKYVDRPICSECWLNLCNVARHACWLAQRHPHSSTATQGRGIPHSNGGQMVRVVKHAWQPATRVAKTSTPPFCVSSVLRVSTC